MQIVMAAVNSIGRITEGDQLVIDLGVEVENGQIVVCAPGENLEYYRPELVGSVIGRVVRFYADPLPKSNVVASLPTLQTSLEAIWLSRLDRLA